MQPPSPHSQTNSQADADGTKSWRFLSNHTQVLLCIQRDPDARFLDIAQTVGITERAAQRIVADWSNPATSKANESADATITASTPTSPCATPPKTATRSESVFHSPCTTTSGTPTLCY